MEALIPIIVVLLFAGYAGFRAITRLICIAGPNEVLVFSGPSVSTGSGKRGYRALRGGRRIRIPLIEKVNRLDLTNMIIDVSIAGAYSTGGIPLNVQAVANVKISSDGPCLDNAMQRLLGKSREEIMRIAKETLEGNLRGVLATLTPEQVNEDKMAFAQSLLEEAEHDLSILGLELDTLSIQNVTDDQGYLHAIGRKQSAELQRSARIAEARARAEAVITSARNSEQTAVAQIDAQIDIARAEARRRIIDAESRREAVVAEQQAEVTALIARAEAEKAVQLARIEQVERQLNADMVEPARARRDAQVYQAIGDAARVVEEGRARAEALHELADVYAQHGDDAKRVLVMQKLDHIIDLMTSIISQIRVDNMTLIDGNGGEPSGTLGIVRTLEELKGATGVDVAGIANRIGGPKATVGSTEPAPAPPPVPRSVRAGSQSS